MRFLLLCTLLLLIAGCGYTGAPGSNENQYFNPGQQEYFEGYDGVEMKFQNIPPKLFYYAVADSPAANEFPISLELQNLGSSHARGAVFLSGFDPNVIKFGSIPLDSFAYQDACRMRIGHSGFNELGLAMDCGGFQLYGHEGNWFERISIFGSKIFGDNVLSNFGVHFSDMEAHGGTKEILVNFDISSLGIDQSYHGVYLIGALAGLSFERWLGQEWLLAGDTYEYPGGEYAYVDYTGLITNWPVGADEMEQHILATSCYMYTTFAAPMVCIDPQPYGTNRKVCSPTGIKYSRGQGAPVAITSIVQENTPRQAVFHITVENRGGGTVFDPGALEKCSPYYPGGAKSNDLNTVWFGPITINNYPLDCTPKHSLRLQNNRGTFTCTYPIEYAQLNSAYQTPLVAELWYGYSKTLDRRVQIKRIT